MKLSDDYAHRNGLYSKIRPLTKQRSTLAYPRRNCIAAGYALCSVYILLEDVNGTFALVWSGEKCVELAIAKFNCRRNSLLGCCEKITQLLRCNKDG